MNEEIKKELSKDDIRRIWFQILEEDKKRILKQKEKNKYEDNI